MTAVEQTEVWEPYASDDGVARIDHGWCLWRQPARRRRRLAHWLDERHPHRERFLARRAIVAAILAMDESPVSLDRRLRGRGTSLRAVAREILPVFGSFFE